MTFNYVSVYAAYIKSIKKIPEPPKNDDFVNRSLQISFDFLLAYLMQTAVFFKIWSVKIDWELWKQELFFSFWDVEATFIEDNTRHFEKALFVVMATHLDESMWRHT